MLTAAGLFLLPYVPAKLSSNHETKERHSLTQDRPPPHRSHKPPSRCYLWALPNQRIRSRKKIHVQGMTWDPAI